MPRQALLLPVDVSVLLVMDFLVAGTGIWLEPMLLLNELSFTSFSSTGISPVAEKRGNVNLVNLGGQGRPIPRLPPRAIQAPLFLCCVQGLPLSTTCL